MEIIDTVRAWWEATTRLPLGTRNYLYRLDGREKHIVSDPW